MLVLLLVVFDVAVVGSEADVEEEWLAPSVVVLVVLHVALAIRWYWYCCWYCCCCCWFNDRLFFIYLCWFWCQWFLYLAIESNWLWWW